MSIRYSGVILLLLLVSSALWAITAGKRTTPPAKYYGHPAVQAPVNPMRMPRAALDDLYTVSGPLPIPDNPGNNTNDTLISVLNISDATTITDLNVRLVISHSWVRDLYVSLTGPGDSAETVLLDLLPQDGADTLDGWFDDAAGISIMDPEAPLVGIWRPTELLEHYNEQSAQGNWTLRVWDRFRLDSGYVALWGVDINREIVLSGTVTNSASESPIPDVQVRAVAVLDSSSYITMTNSSGFYSFDLMNNGIYNIEFTKRLYDSVIVENVTIQDGNPQTVNASMISQGAVAIDEDFERTTPGQLPRNWMQVDGDSGTVTDTTLPSLSQWQVYEDELLPAHSGTRLVGVHYNSNKPNNDWLILPPITATGAITLSLWAASQDPEYPETFEIRVSTNGSDTASFTDLISTHSNVPSDWTQYSHDLSAYSGDQFYIALRYIANDQYVLKIDDVLVDYISSVYSPRASVSNPGQISFDGNYPNPFNATTVFRFDLPQRGRVELVIYNTLGQEAARVMDGMLEAGAHQVSFSAAELPSGLYFARLTAHGLSQTKKLVLLK